LELAMASIFLSHSGKDEQIAEKFRNQLEQMNSKVYMFEHDQQPGTNVTSKLTKAIDDSEMIFVLLTKQSEHSSYVHQEIGFAKKAGKHIIPFVEAGTDPSILGMLTGEEYLKFDPTNPDKSVSDAQTYVHNHDMQKYVEGALILFGVAALCLLLYFSYKNA
jgi:hypothetical protein